MRIIIITLSLLALLFSCTSNTIYKKPDNLIPKEQMVDLLTDMFIANSAYGIKNISLQRKIDYLPLVYEKYQIDSARFQDSNLYYMSRIDDYEEIYKAVESQLKKKYKEAEEVNRIADSLKLKETNDKALKKNSKKEMLSKLEKYKK